MASASSRQPGTLPNGIDLVEIQDTAQEWADLNSFILDSESRQKQGIRSNDFTTDELEGLRRCECCRKRVTSKCLKVSYIQDGERFEIDERRSTGPCNIHPRELKEGKYACCGHGKLSIGCTQVPAHKNTQTLQELEKDFKLFETPLHSRHPRRCVVLDCEMGVASTGESELIRLSVVDYFSGETLIDAMVSPTSRLLHPNTRYSGVTWQMLHEAKRTGRAILGRDTARRRIWNIVGADTVVVVHGGHGDFLSLRWIHHKVADTQMCEHRRAVPVKSPSLKNLAKIHLGRDIQRARQAGHDSLEDAQATRDLAHFYIQELHTPAKKMEEIRNFMSDLPDEWKVSYSSCDETDEWGVSPSSTSSRDWEPVDTWYS